MGLGCRRLEWGGGHTATGTMGVPAALCLSPWGSRCREETCLEVTWGGRGRVGPPGGTQGQEGVLGRGRGEEEEVCMVPNAPRGPAAPTFGPEEGKGVQGHARGRGALAWPPRAGQRPGSPRPPSRSPGLRPRPPKYVIYSYISTHAHTRSEGNRGDPKKRRKTPQQPVPEESKTQPGRGGGIRGGPGTAPGWGGPGLRGGGRGQRPPAHFLFLSWLASQSRPS